MFFPVVTCLILVLNYECTGADSKFMNTVRNLTNFNNGTKQNEEGFRKKIAKYLEECRSEDDKDYSSSLEHTASDKRAFRRGLNEATYSTLHHNRQQQTRNYNNRNENGNVDGYLMNYGGQSGCENRNSDRRDFLNGGQNKNSPDAYDQNRNYFGVRNRYEPRQDYTRTNRDFNEGFPRWKRDYNDRCVSQCVFNYLELLDENRSPSESAFIQFLQDNVSNSRERLRIVREARRCFAKFVTAEEEDGCDFSKSLSKCLRLNLD